MKTDKHRLWINTSTNKMHVIRYSP